MALPARPEDFTSASFWADWFRGGPQLEWYAKYENVQTCLGQWLQDALSDARVARPSAAPGDVHILVVGCGDSDLSVRLADDGWTCITSVDVDGAVVSRMARTHGRSHPTLRWLVADVTAMSTVETASVDVVLDKGTLDAMLPSASTDAAGAARYFRECARVLRPTGTHITISLLQPHVWQRILNDLVPVLAPCALLVRPFPVPDYAARIPGLVLRLRRAAMDAGHMNVPARVCVPSRIGHEPHPEAARGRAPHTRTHTHTRGKRKVDDAAQDVCEDASNVDMELTCYRTPDGGVGLHPSASSSVAALDVGLAHTRLWFGTQRQLAAIHVGNAVSLDVWATRSSDTKSLSHILAPSGSLLSSNAPEPGSDSDAHAHTHTHTHTSDHTRGPRYTLAVQDAQPIPSCACVLVPQGREHEWLFSSAEGRAQLASSAGVGRIVCVALNRGHAFASQREVQNELAPIVVRLLPPELIGSKIPFLAVADDIGQRTLVRECVSVCSGTCVVEDVNADAADFPPVATRATPCALRRLVFLSNRNAIQSEALLRDGAVDPLQLCFEYHQAMAAAMRWLAPADAPSSDAQRIRVVIIGLGSGALATFLATAFPWMAVTCIELDPAIVDIARECFACPIQTVGSLADILPSLPPPGAVNVAVGDGLAMLHDMTSPPVRIDALIIDVDAKDSTTGLSFPPKAFVTKQSLAQMRACVSRRTPAHRTGAVIMNVAARSKPVRGAVLGAIAREFGESRVCLTPMDEDVNVCVCALVRGSAPTDTHTDAHTVAHTDEPGAFTLPDAIDAAIDWSAGTPASTAASTASVIQPPQALVRSATGPPAHSTSRALSPTHTQERVQAIVDAWAARGRPYGA